MTEFIDVFRLSKWYFDVVTAEGTVFVGYAARLRWGPLRLRYRSAFVSHSNDVARDMATLRRSPDPFVDDAGTLYWRCDPLSIDGVWSPRASPIRRRLFSGAAGVIDWECLLPSAHVRLVFGDESLHGLGYAERLRMTAAPWELPMDELLWGRFIARGTAIVWIDWRGSSPRRVVFRDGVEQTIATIDDSCVSSLDGGTRLTLDRCRIIRDAPLSDTLSAVPLLRRAVGRRLSEARESKYLSRGTLAADGEPTVDGWAIHEVVTWRSRERT